MKSFQVARAHSSEPNNGFLRWAFPGLFLRKKGESRAFLVSTHHASKQHAPLRVRVSFDVKRQLP